MRSVHLGGSMLGLDAGIDDDRLCRRLWTSRFDGDDADHGSKLSVHHWSGARRCALRRDRGTGLQDLESDRTGEQRKRWKYGHDEYSEPRLKTAELESG